MAVSDFKYHQQEFPIPQNLFPVTFLDCVMKIQTTIGLVLELPLHTSEPGLQCCHLQIGARSCLLCTWQRLVLTLVVEMTESWLWHEECVHATTAVGNLSHLHVILWIIWHRCSMNKIFQLVHHALVLIWLNRASSILPMHINVHVCKHNVILHL